MLFIVLCGLMECSVFLVECSNLLLRDKKDSSLHIGIIRETEPFEYFFCYNSIPRIINLFLYMKKIIIVCFILSILSQGMWAQERKHEVSAGAGLFTTSEIIGVFSNVLATGLTGGLYSADESYSGAYHVNYKYRFTERFSFGGTALYEHADATAKTNNEVYGKYKNNYYTLAAEMDYRYLNNDYLKLYGTLGAGATLYTQKYVPNTGDTDTDKMVHFNFQITPIGIKFGKTIGVFAEAGFGYKGILSAGLFANF